MQEKASRTASLGAIGFMIVAIIFAGIAGVLLSQVVQSTYSQEPVEPIVVAARNIPAAQAIVKEDLKVAFWPRSSIPKGAFSSVKAALKEKRVALIPLVKGESVLASHLSKPNAGIGIAPLLEPNKRAMSIRTDKPATLSRLLYPGCLADVLVTAKYELLLDENKGSKRRKKETIEPKFFTRTVLQAVKVLAVGWDIDPVTSSRRTSKVKKDDEKVESHSDLETKEARAVVTLAVSPEEAEILALASREGKVDVVLRNPKDTAVVATGGTTPIDFFPFGSLASEQVEEQTAKNDDNQRVRVRPRRRVSHKKPGKSGKNLIIIK